MKRILSITLALAFVVSCSAAMATDWAPVGQPVQITGSDSVQTGDTVQIQVEGNPDCGGTAFSGQVVTEGLDVLEVSGDMSTPKTLLLLGDLGSSVATYTCRVTASTGQKAYFGLANSDISDGATSRSFGVYPWSATVGSENTEQLPCPVRVLGPGWGSLTGATIEIELSLDRASGMEGFWAAWSADGMQLISASPAWVATEGIMLGAGEPATSTLVFRSTAAAGEAMRFWMRNAICSDGSKDIEVEAPLWSQTVREDIAGVATAPADPPSSTANTSPLVPSAPTASESRMPFAPSSSSSMEPPIDQQEPSVPVCPSSALPTSCEPPSPSITAPDPAQQPSPGSGPSKDPQTIVPAGPSALPGQLALDAGILRKGTPIHFVTDFDGTYVVGYVAASTRGAVRIGELRDQFTLGANVQMHVSDAGGNPKNAHDPICTGDLAVFEDSSGAIKQAAIVVHGDIAGTGTASLLQLVRMATAYRGDACLAGAFLLAADFTGDGTVGLTDLVAEAQLYRNATR